MDKFFSQPARLLNYVNQFLIRLVTPFNTLPRFWVHVLFWIWMGSMTANQFGRMFSLTFVQFFQMIYRPVSEFPKQLYGFWLVWPVHFILTIAFFYWLGYYVIPNYWNKKKPVQFTFFFSVYWLLSSYTIPILFGIIVNYFKPAPAYIDGKYKTFASAHWYDFFSNLELILINWAFNFSYVLVPILIKSKRDEAKTGRQILKLEQEKLNMELSFLRSQINPHFLFNAFNNLYTLIRRGNKTAATILADLSDILRYALYKTSSDLVPLKGELLFIVNYVRLESIRFSANKHISCELQGEPENFGIPPMIIIPFIENAFKHGLSSSIHEASLTINFLINTRQERLEVRIINTKQPNYKPSKIGGIGLVNVRKRLELLMKGRYHLETQDTPVCFAVTLIMPLQRLVHGVEMDEEALPFPFYHEPVSVYESIN